MKRVLSIALVVVMLAFLFACGNNNAPATTTPAPGTGTTGGTTSTPRPAPAQSGNPATIDSMYSGVDLSTQGHLVTIWLGDTPTDMQVVLDELNPILLSKANTTIETQFLSWAEWNTRYSLLLAAGEPCDMIFTGDWAYYSVEAAKGSFMEITDEWMARVMPQAHATHPAVAFDQMRIDGKVYAVPYAYEVFNESMLVIRDDLRVKYDLPELTSMETLEAFLFAVADNETDLFAYNTSRNNDAMGYLTNKANNWIQFVPGYGHFVYQYTGQGQRPSSADVMFRFATPEYREFAHRMREWNQRGVFPANALNNDIHPRDSFENGRSAMLNWNLTVFRAGENMEKNNPEWIPGYFDIFPNAPKIPDRYSNAANAIPTYAKDPDRVGVVMDLLFYDKDAHFTFLGGVEGKHFIWEEQYKLYEPGPEFTNYQWCAFPWSLQIADEAQRAGRHPVEVYFVEQVWPRSVVHAITAGFRVDDSGFVNEWAAVSALIDEYAPQLNLGVVANVDALLDEFLAAIERAGLPAIEQSIKDQLDTYMTFMS